MRKLALVLCSSTILFAACSGAGGPGTGIGTGTVNLAVTDAAVDSASAVIVQFTGVSVKPKGGPQIDTTFAVPRQIDLLALNGGGSALLLNAVSLPSGDYEFVRLNINAGRDASDSYITLNDGSKHALFVPSGDQSGLKLVNGFSVPEGAVANFTIDFDLRKSVIKPKGSDGVYTLKPTLRIVENSQSGTLTGEVSSSLATALGCTPAIYVYPGANATTGDEGSANAPLTSAFVKLDSASGKYLYNVAFLPVGAFTAAFTCDADADAPDVGGDGMAFMAAASTTIFAGQTSVVNFQ